MPRKGASSHRTKYSKRNTKHKSKDKKEEIEEEKKQQFANDQQQINPIQKRKPKDFGITCEVSKRIKDVEIEMEDEIDFEHLESKILEMEKNAVTNKELKFAFAQPTNWDNFSYEDNSEPQEDENDSRSQVSQRQHMISKTQEVWVNEEFEDDSENGKSINEKKTKGDNQTQKDLLNINNQSLVRNNMKKSEKVQLLEEVQEKMEISSEFANQQEVEAAIMQAWEKANENEKKEFKLKKEQAKQRKNENIEDMKLEQTKKEKAIQDMLDRGMSPNKIFQENKMGMSRSSIYNRKKKYDQNISLVERQPGSGRNPKLTELAEGFILGLIIANNTLKWGGIKEKLKQYFNIEISKKTIEKILNGYHILWTIPLWKPLLNPEIIKKRLKFCQDHQYKANFERWVFTDETHFWLKNSGEMRWIMKGEDYIQSTTKTGNLRINCYGAFSKHKKYSLSFFKENMDSKKNIYIYSMCKENYSRNYRIFRIRLYYLYG